MTLTSVKESHIHRHTPTHKKHHDRYIRDTLNKRITGDSVRDHRQFFIFSSCPCCPRQRLTRRSNAAHSGHLERLLFQKQINGSSIAANQTLIGFLTLIAVGCRFIQFRNRYLVSKDFNNQTKMKMKTFTLIC